MKKSELRKKLGLPSNAALERIAKKLGIKVGLTIDSQEAITQITEVVRLTQTQPIGEDEAIAEVLDKAEPREPQQSQAEQAAWQATQAAALTEEQRELQMVVPAAIEKAIRLEEMTNYLAAAARSSPQVQESERVQKARAFLQESLNHRPGQQRGEVNGYKHLDEKLADVAKALSAGNGAAVAALTGSTLLYLTAGEGNPKSEGKSAPFAVPSVPNQRK